MKTTTKKNHATKSRTRAAKATTTKNERTLTRPKMLARSVLVYGPPGCGKTTNADALRRAFGLLHVTDGWIDSEETRKTIPPFEFLILTHTPPTGEIPKGVLCVSFEDAARGAGIPVLPQPLPPPTLPTPRELADREALRILTSFGRARRNAMQSAAIGVSDDIAKGESWAYGDALEVLALERAAAISERGTS